jgi:hypothetical protein
MLSKVFGQLTGKENLAARWFVEDFISTEAHGLHARLSSKFNNRVLLAVIDQIHAVYSSGGQDILFIASRVELSYEISIGAPDLYWWRAVWCNIFHCERH